MMNEEAGTVNLRFTSRQPRLPEHFRLKNVNH